MKHLVRYGDLYPCRSHVGVYMLLLLVVNCCLEVGIKLRCSCQAVYCPGCAAGRSQGQKSGLQGFLLCTAQGTTEYFRISLEEDCPLVTRASVAFYSLHLCIVEGRSSAPCVSRLSPPPNNRRCWLSARSPPPLSPHHLRRLCCQRATSPHDAAAARFTRTILLTTHVNTGRTANTTSTHHPTHAWSRTVTRSCHASYEEWQQQ